MKLIQTVFVSAMFLSACSGNGKQGPDLTKVPELEITATHAIDIEESVEGLSFVPNNVAPWLGRLVLLNTDASISTTDIEGRSFLRNASVEQSDTFGLARENASGVYLTINKNNELGAHIESDDEGNFAPLYYSGSNISPVTFCRTDSASQTRASILTTDNKLSTISISVTSNDENKNSPAEQEIVSTLPAPANTLLCATSGDQVFAYSKSGSEAYLHMYGNDNWTDLGATSNITAITPINLADTLYLLLLDSQNVFLLNTANRSIEHRLVVNSGLSIGGLEKTKFIGSTTHNFGGAAFSEGLIAFGQADEDRVVFVSKSYLEGVLGGSGV